MIGNLVNNPRWWQRLFPRYGNWGGIGWSAGIWNNDPSVTDWNVPAIDGIDEFFKWHDWQYQHNKSRWNADRILVRDLWNFDASSLSRYGKGYRIGAMVVFSIWPRIRRTYEKLREFFIC